MVVLLSLVLLGLLLFLLLVLYIHFLAEIDNRSRSDVILILGALPTIKGSQKTNPCLFERVKQGGMLLHLGYAKKIILSGGRRATGTSDESLRMKTLAIAEGIPAKYILLERRAHSTYENILFTKQIMDNNNYHSVIIVTDPFHMPRATLIAKKLQLNFTVSPATNSPCSKNRYFRYKYLCTEAVAIIVYFLLGRI